MNVLPALLVAAGLSAAPKVAIVELNTLDTLGGIGSQVTRALVDNAGAQSMTVVAPEAVRTLIGAKKYDALRSCAQDVSCAASALQGTDITRVVTGVLGRDEKNYLLKLWLLDVSSVSVVTSIDRATLIASRRFQRDVEQAIPAFLRGEKEAMGTLVINSPVKNAQVFVNGEFIGMAPQTIERKPGKYEVRVERKKYLPVTRLMNIEASQTATENFRLLLAPGQLPDEQEVPELAAAKAAEPEAPPIALSTGTWFCGAATIAAAGVGIYFGATASRADVELAAGFNKQTMTYGGTRRQAQEAQRNAIVANVAFGVAGAAAIGTALFLLSDLTKKTSSESVTVVPVLTADGAAVSVGGSF